MSTELTIIIPEQDNLPPSLLSNIKSGFMAAFEQAEKWRQQALSIKVTSLDQTAEMKLARTIRLELKAIRVSAEKTRKNLKADALMMGRAVDGTYNLLEAAIAPLERHLDEQEKFAERLAEAERLRVKAEREAALAPYLTEGQVAPSLEVMTPESFASFLADAKLLHEAKIEAAKKAEADRIAKEQAEAAERERMRLENERLKKEVEEREAAAKIEREKVEAERAAAAAKLKAEQEKAAAELAEQQRIAAKAAAEAEAKARAEREAIEDKARAEREAAEKQLAAERAERERLEKIAANKAAAELAEAQAILAAKAAAEAVPDKERLTKLAQDIRSLSVPAFTSKKAITLTDQIKTAIEELAVRVENAAAKL